MSSVLVYVEGQTEETFVWEVLYPRFSRCGLYLKPVLARTKRTKSGQTFKGGIVSYRRVRRDVLRLLGDTSAALVTTMIDYYGLPDEFPGKKALLPGTPDQRVEQLEEAFAADIGNARFLPFLVLHEFEALILSRPQEIGRALPQYRKRIPDLVRDIQGQAPEEIDEGPDTHPAARILRYFPGYRKALDGPKIARYIGLDTMRSKCPHFDGWLRRLEGLCQT